MNQFHQLCQIKLSKNLKQEDGFLFWGENLCVDKGHRNLTIGDHLCQTNPGAEFNLTESKNCMMENKIFQLNS